MFSTRICIVRLVSAYYSNEKLCLKCLFVFLVYYWKKELPS